MPQIAAQTALQLPATAHALAVDPNTGHLYLADDTTLTLYDPAHGHVLARVLLDVGPGGLVVDAGTRASTGHVFVASREHKAILALNAQTLAVRRKARRTSACRAGWPRSRPQTEPYASSPPTPWPARSLVSAGDLRTLTEVAVGAGRMPWPAGSGADAGGRVFLALTGDAGVAVLDADTAVRLTVTPLDGLGFPQGLAVDEAGARVYVIYTLSPHYRQIAALDGDTGAIVEIIPAALDRPLTGAQALAVDPVQRRLLVSAEEGVFAYDLARGGWTTAPDAPLIARRCAAPISAWPSMPAAPVYLASPAGHALPWMQQSIARRNQVSARNLVSKLKICRVFDTPPSV